jgi:hypothetical protein
MSARSQIACVVCETGAANYLTPLLGQWALCAQQPLALYKRPHVEIVPPLHRFVTEVTSPSQIAIGQEVSLVIMSATDDPFEHAVRKQAVAQGVRVIQVVDTWYGYARRFASGTYGWPDVVAVVDKAARHEALAEDVPPERIRAIGNPAWERVQRLPEAPENRIAFVAQPVAAKLGSTLGYTEHDAWAVLRNAIGHLHDDDVSLVYCPHPDEPMTGARDGWPTHDGQTALAMCGTVVGMYSSLLCDAFLGGRHVVSLQPRATGDMCPLSRHGRIERTTCAQELEAALRRRVPSRIEELRGTLAGSTDRLLQLVEELRHQTEAAETRTSLGTSA